MANSTTKIVVVAVVAILIIAAVGVFALGGNDEKDTEQPSVAGLPVYGNANNDETIDAADRTIIQNIIDKKDGYTFTAYPFADANYDQRVDSKDLDIVNKIINGQKTPIYHYSYHAISGKTLDIRTVESVWPLDNAIVASTNVLTIMKVLGLEDKVCASPDKSKDGWYDPELLAYLEDPKVIAMGDMSTSIVDQVSDVMDKTHTHAFIGASYSGSIPSENELENLGCDTIRINDSNLMINELLGSTLLIGFLFQSEDRAQEVTKLYADVWNGLLDVADTITGEKVKFAPGLAFEDHALSVKCQIAGGEYAYANVADAPLNAWGSGYEMGDWIYKVDIDCFLNVTWSNKHCGSFFAKEGPDAEAMLGSGMGGTAPYKNLECYKNNDLYCIYGGLPVIMDALNAAYVMYPEQYGDLYEKSFDLFFEYLGENKDGVKFADLGLKMFYSIDEVKALAEKQKA